MRAQLATAENFSWGLLSQLQGNSSQESGNRRLFFLHALFLQMHWQISWEVQRKGTELGHEEGTAQVNRTRVSPQAIWSYTWHSSIKDSGTSGTKENSTSSRITAHSRRQANCLGTQLGSFYLQIFCGMQVMVTARYKRSTQKERNRLKGQM